MKNNRRLRVRVRFILFYSELAPLTRDVTCSRLYLDEKNMNRKCQINNLLCINTWKQLFADVLQNRCSKIFQNSQENICARVSFRESGLKPAALLKKDCSTGVSLGILRNVKYTILQKTSWRLLLNTFYGLLARSEGCSQEENLLLSFFGKSR